MKNRDIRVCMGNLTLKYEDKSCRHEIMAWLGYGIVMPSLCTTNGSIEYLTSYLFSLLQYNEDIDEDLSDIKIQIGNSVIDEFYSKKEIFEILKSNYEKIKEEHNIK